MKVKIQKSGLVGLLAKAQNIVEKRNTMPILVNVLMDAEKSTLKVFATNLEVSLTDEVEVKVVEPGRVAVNAKSLFDIVKELPDGEVTLEKQTNNWLLVTQGKAVFNIVGISPEEYPVFPTYNTKEFMKIDAIVLSEMIEKTIYSVSNDETRYHLNGVYFERSVEQGVPTYKMVATDGHRLSLVSRSGSEQDNNEAFNEGVIIPRKGLNEIRKLLEGVEGQFELALEGAQLIVRKDKTVLMIRLIEGKYPNYKQLIPQNLKENVSLNRDLLLSSLKRVSLLSNQKSKGVTFSITKGKMEITSNNPELGEAHEEIEINYGGVDLKIGFNAKYILDVLSSMDEEEVSFELKDQLSPGLMRPHHDKNYTCVIMPMRI
ncbi:MAG: DNA polymerase III subunit beta [Bdellovibrionaceae bacterium]|nr:DNA polymerase III subunit beta [Pseudobdellovibrionaceae bacterium]